jgi:hypothetical protein
MLRALRFCSIEEQSVTAVYYVSPVSYGATNISGLSAIPPERVGLQGEYDYYGLAHRIQAQFHEYIDKAETANIVVKQRGSAIILTGSISKAELLNELVALAMAADGVTQVEICNMAIHPKQCVNVA